MMKLLSPGFTDQQQRVCMYSHIIIIFLSFYYFNTGLKELNIYCT